MSDRIVLAGMTFLARHGVHDREKVEAQRFEVDLELALDVRPAALDDDLARTVDYGGVYQVTRQVVESMTFDLIEALAEAIAHEVLDAHPLVDEVVVRIRKPDVRLDGPLDYAGVEIRRGRERSS
ncbi:MAG TPA: dihydroneopterin aldolase [Candidatus Limnocylindria bacterium]|nr:dihydroneopterin aldolase [Candidatus Limnocylindria bacterium]